MRAWPIAMALLAGAGCASKEKVVVDVDALDLDYAFTVSFDDQGEVVRTRPAFGTLPSGALFGVQRASELADDEVRVILVGLKTEDLPPQFDATRADELVALNAPAPDQLTRTSVAREARVRGAIGVPNSAGLFEVQLAAEQTPQKITSSEAPALHDVTIELPLDPEFCRPTGPLMLAPFGESAHPLTGRDVDIRSIVPVAEDRLVVADRVGVYFVDRGQPGAPAAVLSLAGRPSGDPRDAIESIAVSDADAVGVREVVVSGAILQGEPPKEERHGFAHVARYHPTEGLSWTDVSTRTAGRRLFGATFVGPETWIGSEGGLLERTRGQSDFSWRAVPIEGGPDVLGLDDHIINVRAAPGDNPFVIAGSRNRIHLYLGEERWTDTFEDLRNISLTETLNFAALAITEPGPAFDAWAAGGRGAVMRLNPDSLEFEKVDIDYPPSFLRCAAYDPTVEDRIIVQKDYRRAEIVGEHVYFSHQDCDVIVAIRRVDPACTWILDADDVPQLGMSKRTFRAMTRIGESLIVGTTDGEILIVDLSEGTR